MGLDMYLEGRLMEVREDGAEIVYGGHRTALESYTLQSREELAYWRKHWSLHNAIVNEFGGGVDDMEDIALSADDIDAVLATLMDADAQAERQEQADETRWTKEFTEQREQDLWRRLTDIRAFAKARVWLLAEKPGIKRSVVYRADW